MSDRTDPPSEAPGLSAAKRALLEKLRASTGPKRLSADPVAVVGLHCRFPKADGPEAFWRLLRGGCDAIAEVPAQRWDVRTLPGEGLSSTEQAGLRWGGFLERVDAFDAAFFGISPREAATMDPQHRILLEQAWHALEDAGLCREDLARTRTGVYTSVYQRDFARLALADRLSIDAYTTSGTHHSIAANRLSYILDLRGPSLTVDTACSSSLVAVSLACRALLHGEIDRAVVGAVNLILEPEETLSLARWGMLAADGRCKTFDARADGFVRGEGCGVLVLERERDAQAAGRAAHAMILGTALNQDGRSNGLTAPNGDAQRAVIREALTDAGLDPSRISYVEAHGTGTSIGDPIEMEALKEVLNSGEPHPGVLVGSVKTNIGHLEAAAGMAGLIKTILSMEQQTIVPSLHLRELNPAITLEGTQIAVAAELQPWEDHGRPLAAGVSAFGMGGTNAHLIVGQAAALPEAPPRKTEQCEVLVLSAHDPAALEEMARSYQAMAPEQPLASTCAAACRRTAHPHRLAMAASSPEQLAERLQEWLDRGAHGSQVSNAVGGWHGVALVFPGQGSQWPGMGRQLMAQEPAFRESMERCDEALQDLEGWSLLDILQAPAGDPRWDRVEVIQPTLLATQISLAAVWQSWGVFPDGVVGHSMGEAAAAHVAGALSLEQAMSVIGRRSRVMSRCRRQSQGSMVAVNLPLKDAQAAIAGLTDRLSVAVVNGPASTVLSGESGPLNQVVQELEANDVFCRPVAVDIASHSPAMDDILAPLATELSDISPRDTRVPFYSTVTGQVIPGRELTPDYWGRNLRDTVRFWEAASQMLEDQYSVFIEVSPHPLLLHALGEGLQERGNKEALLLASGRRGADERELLLMCLGQLFERGVPISWPAVYPGPQAGRPQWPAYPFQRQRYWPERRPRRSIKQSPLAPLSSDPQANLLLGGAGMKLAHQPGQTLFSQVLDPAVLAFTNDHAVEGEQVLPGTGSVEMAQAAARTLWGPRPFALADVEFLRPILLGGRVRVQLRMDESSFSIAAASEQGGYWTERVRGKIIVGALPEERPFLDRQQVMARCPEERTGEELYEHLNATGNLWGPSFQAVKRLWLGQGEILAEIRAPEILLPDLHCFVFHPALLDACGQALAEFYQQCPDSSGEALGPFVLASLERVNTRRTPIGRLWAHITAHGPHPESSLLGDVWIHDDQGRQVAEMKGLCIRFLHHKSGSDQIPARPEDWMVEVEWVESGEIPAPSQPSGQGGRWLLLPDQAGIAEQASLLMRAAAEAVHMDQPMTGTRDVVMLSGLDLCSPQDATAAEVSSAVARACMSMKEQVKELQASGGRLWVVTRGAVEIPGGDPLLHPAQACLWGLARVVAVEYPALFGGLVDLDPRDSAAQAAEQLWRILNRGPLKEPGLALRSGRSWAPRLGRASRQEPGPSLAGLLRPDSAYMVTGGLGGLGLNVAKRLVQRGARRLVLMGRRALPPRSLWRSLDDPGEAAQVKALTELEAMGASVLLAAIDVGDEAALEAFATQWIAEARPPLKGIVHAAGVQHPASIDQMTAEGLEQELRAKVGGTWALRKIWGGADLDFMVLFSSAATLLDSPLLGGYTAANAFLGALAQNDRGQGRPTTAVDWGVWRERGMAQRYADDSGRALEGAGVGSMSPEGALDALELVMAGSAARVGVMPMNWSRWKERHAEAAGSPYLSRLTGEAEEAGAPAEARDGALEGLEHLPEEERLERLEGYLCQRLGQVLHTRPEVLSMTTPLTRLGLDSLMALELRNRFEADAGVTIAVVFILQCRSGKELLERLDAELSSSGDKEEEWEEVTI